MCGDNFKTMIDSFYPKCFEYDGIVFKWSIKIYVYPNFYRSFKVNKGKNSFLDNTLQMIDDTMFANIFFWSIYIRLL